MIIYRNTYSLYRNTVEPLPYDHLINTDHPGNTTGGRIDGVPM